MVRSNVQSFNESDTGVNGVNLNQKGSLKFKIASWNCHGLKSSIDYALKLIKSHNITFLCEHWLLPHELATMKSFFAAHGKDAQFISSVDPMVPLRGRPFGGIGFVWDKSDGYSFSPQVCNSDRIYGLKVYKNHCSVLNIYGIYLPHEGYESQAMTSTECFLEILDKLQVLIDNSEPDCPTILVGDMNTCLPDEPQLDSGWYKRRPYSKRSLILYNFLSNNNLCVGNFNFAQKVNFTYQGSNARSYIDHVFAPEYIMNSIEACTIIEEDANNISDHLPLSTVIMLKSLQSKHDDERSVNVSFPRPKWHDLNFQNLYCDEVRRRLTGLTYPDIQKVTVDTALGYINQLCENISDILHQCVKNCLIQKPPRKTLHNKSWWNRDCDKAKQRN